MLEEGKAFEHRRNLKTKIHWFSECSSVTDKSTNVSNREQLDLTPEPDMKFYVWEKLAALSQWKVQVQIRRLNILVQ
jgi:hypothetical protein